ncbi:hypothetical protein [Rhizobium phaseoli]|uniref:hypothetical protein n=1 Tax=Rhizobium phaseoli TaxID=396 RepID=UPI000F892E01|nr:hypothetical protein [Rhizobium phaseoli]
MLDHDDCYWLPVLPAEIRLQMEKLPPNKQDWPVELKKEYDRLRSDFVRAKAEFTTWFRKDRDSRMNRTCKLILVYLVDCLNFETGRCDPSQQAIADELSIGLSTVERCIRRIADARWIEVVRRGKTTTNFYRLRAPKAKVNALLDNAADLKERRLEARKIRMSIPSDPSKVRDHSDGDPAKMKAHDPSKVRAHDPSEMRGKHINRTPEGEHPNKGPCFDGNEDTYPRESIPVHEAHFGDWVRRNIPDVTRHREAFRLLRERKMTPEILRRLAA